METEVAPRIQILLKQCGLSMRQFGSELSGSMYHQGRHESFHSENKKLTIL